jgi:hypothetical protein
MEGRWPPAPRSPSPRPARGSSRGDAEVAADAGDQFADRAVGEVGVLVVGLETFGEIVEQVFGAPLIGLGVEHPLDGGPDLGLAPFDAARGGGGLRRPAVLGEAGLQGEGLAHGARDAGEDQAEAFIDRAVRVRSRLLDGLPPDQPRQLQANLTQFRESPQMARGTRLGGIIRLGVRGRVGRGHEQNENKRRAEGQGKACFA